MNFIVFVIFSCEWRGGWSITLRNSPRESIAIKAIDGFFYCLI